MGVVLSVPGLQDVYFYGLLSTTNVDSVGTAAWVLVGHELVKLHRQDNLTGCRQGLQAGACVDGITQCRKVQDRS